MINSYLLLTELRFDYVSLWITVKIIIKIVNCTVLGKCFFGSRNVMRKRLNTKYEGGMPESTRVEKGITSSLLAWIALNQIQ